MSMQTITLAALGIWEVLIGGCCVLGVPLLIIVIWAVAIYNSLVRKRVQCQNGWSQIDVQLKRRYDLIPNLVETVKGYASHERQTLEAVTKARQQAIDASSIQDQGIAENMLTGALRQLFALSENYPDLKANQNFIQLQEELVSTENKIGFARQHYNDTVSRYNSAIEMFPSNIIAGMFNFQKREFFEVEDQSVREAPQVEF
jgi:LemA protein